MRREMAEPVGFPVRARAWVDDRRFWRLLPLFIAGRYLVHCLMLIPILYNELLPAPSLPDHLLALFPRIPWVVRWNYVLWMLCYVPPAIYLLLRSRRLFLRFLVVDAALSMTRALVLPLTRFGPPDGPDVNAIHPFRLWDVWWQIINPWRAVAGDTAGIYLTKDMFFSGHIATTFLLYLYSRRLGPRVARVFLGLQLLSLLVVLLSHLHYTVDIVGAYAFTFMLHTLGDRFLRRRFPVLDGD